jgi:hypothetical protein
MTPQLAPLTPLFRGSCSQAIPHSDCRRISLQYRLSGAGLTQLLRNLSLYRYYTTLPYRKNNILFNPLQHALTATGNQLEIASIDTQTTMANIPTTPPSRGLKGKVAIVTGAGCHGEGIGNGRAISITLADEGCNVVCLDLNLEWATKTAQMCMSQPHRGTAIAINSDVTKGPDCEAAVQLALRVFGRLDILVNNVGIGGASGTAVDVNMEAWAKGL